MSFSSLLSNDLQRYARIIQEGVAVRTHFDLLQWLHGEVQHYLPHEIMLSAWGDFGSGSIQHDIVSALPGVRTIHSTARYVSPLLCGLYNQWVERGKVPYTPNIDSLGLLFEEWGQQCCLGTALQGMRSSLMHGISGKHGHPDCLYVIFSSRDNLSSSTLGAMEILLPCLDTALRRITPLSHHLSLLPETLKSEDYGLSDRETEIMVWVKMGKTNVEIASILCISLFTVQNHVMHIFRKLDVYNRQQAVFKLECSLNHERNPSN